MHSCYNPAMTFDVDGATIRVFLHLLGVTVWVGGQVLMGALVPVLRHADDDAPRRAARRFGLVAWPFFALAVVTGLWNTAEVDFDAASNGWRAALFVKLVAVAASGVTAWLHMRAQRAPERAVFAGATLALSLVALLIGAGLVT